MDALLFAFLLILVLDQGDRTQQLTLALAGHGLDQPASPSESGGEETPTLSPMVLLLVCGAVMAASVILAVGGTFIGSYLPARPRLLFLALAILVGGAGFLFPSKSFRPSGLLGSRPALAGRLLLARLNGRAGFGLLGFATYSGDPMGVAAGGLLGGLIASMMALLLGPPYVAFMVRPVVRTILGGGLMIVALPLALTALGLL